MCNLKKVPKVKKLCGQCKDWGFTGGSDRVGKPRMYCYVYSNYCSRVMNRCPRTKGID